MKNLYLLSVTLFLFNFCHAQFSDDMESYTDGQPISVGHWTDWGCGGGAGCAIMSSSAQAHGGILSGYIPPDFSTDAVLDLGNKIFGEWGLSFWAYIPSGKEAYFNLQGVVPIGAGEWIVGNFFFNQDTVNPGVGLVDNTALGAVQFNFPHDQWFRIVMNFDITSGIGFATWHLNISGIDVISPGTPFTDEAGSSPTSLGGIDFFSISTDNQLWLDTFEYENNFISIVPDTEDPIAICQNFTAQLDSNGTVIIDGIDIDGGSTDNVGIQSYTAVPDTFNCNNLGANTVTLIVEDYAGNTDTCTATVTVEDNVNPIVIGQYATGDLNGLGTVTIPVADVDNGSNDNCGIDSLSLTPETYTAIGIFTAVFEVTDTSGNSDSVNVIITIIDSSDGIVEIPDTNFLNALLNTNCVDIDGDGLGDVDADANNDGELQVSEAEIALGLIVNGENINSLEGIQSFINLETLICSNNPLTNLDVSQNTDLSILKCSGTQITVLNLSQNPQLIELECMDNPLTDLNIRSGGNTNLGLLHAEGNTNLYCIQVDDADYANNNPNWYKDNWTVYSEDCSLGIDDIISLDISIYPNPVKDLLTIDNTSTTEITSIRLYDVLERLVMTINGDVKQIDVSRLTSGLLFFEIETDQGVFTKKIVKE